MLTQAVYQLCVLAATDTLRQLSSNSSLLYQHTHLRQLLCPELGMASPE